MSNSNLNKKVIALLFEYAGTDPACPVCKADLSERVRANLMDGKVVYCKACGNRTNWRYGTDLHMAKISEWQYLCMLIGFKLYPPNPTPDDFKRASSFLELDIESVKFWHKKITGNGAAA